MRSLHVTFAELRATVATNAKQRFELVPVDPAPAPTSAANGAPSSTSDTDDAPFNNDLDPRALGDPSRYLIRATQGHSLPLASAALLAPLLPSDPATPRLAVHGTTRRAWALILQSGGLSRMTRTHVHFAPGLGGEGGELPAEKAGPKDALGGLGLDDEGEGEEEGGAPKDDRKDEKEEEDKDAPRPATDAAPVISGMRPTASVFVWVALRKSAEQAVAVREQGAPEGRPRKGKAGDEERGPGAEDAEADPGLTWWRSANGVLLTEGDSRGLVPLEWVVCVEQRRKDGKRVRVWVGKGTGAEP